jgi:hypothetical protein
VKPWIKQIRKACGFEITDQQPSTESVKLANFSDGKQYYKFKVTLPGRKRAKP